MITTELTYRLYKDKDLKGLRRLWEDSSGWGGITEEQFHQWYFKTPHGPCVVIVATDDSDGVVGQLVFTPSLVHVDGKDVKALRAAAPILNKSLPQGRITDYDHPVFAMFRKGMEISKQQGYTLIYLFPALGWTTVLKLFPKYGLPHMQPSSFDCFTISLKDASTFYLKLDERYVELLASEFDEEYDHLWDQVAKRFPIRCGVIRNANWLNWKLGGHSVFEIRYRDTKKLSGYVAVKKESGLIVDMLARTEEDLLRNLELVVRTIHDLNPDRIPSTWTELKGMYSPLFQSLFSHVKTTNFSFAFGCCPLVTSISPEQIAPALWYMMPND